MAAKNPPINRLLVTGAAGIVGTLLRPLLVSRYPEIVLSDVTPIEDCAANERFVHCDVADLESVCGLVRDVDAIVHLAGVVGPDFTFDQVLSPNIIGTYNVFEAARRSGVSRVVYTSSNHAVGFYQRSAQIDHTALPRPDSFYGISKAFGEAVGAYYADKYGLAVLCIRIGYVGEQAIDERRTHIWISPRDLMQLIEIGLHTKHLNFQIVYGVSDNCDPFFDNLNAFRLGFRPQDRASEHLADESLQSARPDPTKPADQFVGGAFVTRRQELGRD